MKKLKKISIQDKLKELDTLTEQEQSELKGGYTYGNNSFKINPAGGTIGRTF
ncbi:MAG: hypothetical protein LUG96_05250 [Tannerellaceae bacterium]|nr:hypothetical protein [Tannerellaceae bacterium]MCC8134863.1 hypothetical protein [Tannerellaceae bacterium]MCD7914710.1 hypothetical protein [Tannerellaceae bacterium]